ncbi:bifunctional acetate--CoA ligase family protein/GNAT family N-acetyltransferase [Nocardioides marmoribigeumensis]|uniref:Acyl-CoA synthetase (NDP forming)/L-amino acid N-acyltransferase YncA n=1 Tax=Nocardioides marmoribigeumensis TaxID=433649 RepID=A0ABU2BR95_9ACTN|nr:GNAT family N-acetyltransferase [Nocardioides marmoribigeumensis]MDR7361172.1 acyl-CoA synthetase (NDP forming)/L-amino acid N-acyltransferase YncA [Nocardioides marmoribigeumensis]
MDVDLDGAATYPAHWEADVVLRDGGTAHLRPIGRDDVELLQEFYAEVSPRSKYYRFFAAMPTLSEREVSRFVDVDHDHKVALVAEVAEKMIAVGQFERIDGPRPRAEVAFLVQDRHHHRGIGQLLLEHLAQIGRELAIEEFVAEVLPDNTGMLQVFRDAGYEVKGGFEDGVVAMRFAIDATETSVGVMLAREHRADTASVQHFLGARSVAVIGASRREDTVGRMLVRNIVLGDFQGRVYVVNPAAGSVAGMPAYASVTDIPDEVEIAVIAVPADAVPDVILDCAHKGVRGVVVVSSGFAESGREGRALQRRVLRLCRTYGLRLIGPNCLGVINTATDLQLNASLSPLMPPRGRAGFFCQSGALGVAILENVSRRGLGLSTFVSAGNRADVSGNDLLQYWEEDDSTEVVLLYLESLGNPRKFSRISRRVSRRKPVIVVKSGRTTQGVPMGHTVRSSEVGPVAVDAMFRQAGVIQVDSIDEMFDVAQLLAHQPLPRGRRLGVVSNSDALALLANDAAVATGLEARWVGDLRPDADAGAFEHALDEALDDPEIDAVLAVYLPPVDTSGTEVANVLAVVGEQSDKPVVSSFLAAEGVPELLRVPDATGSSAGRGSVPSYSSPAAAVVALAHAASYAEWLARPEAEPEPDDEVDLVAGRTVVTRALSQAYDGRALTDAELHDLLAAYGVQLWRRLPVADEEQAVAAGAELGWDVILKSTAEHLRQRPDLAHVWRNIDNEEEMRDAWRTMTQSVLAPGTEPGFVVQRRAPAGVSLSVKGVEDPLFGPVVSFGMAGFVSDLLGDTVFRIPPLHRQDAAEMVREIKAAPLLLGYRGSEPVELTAVEDLVLRVARLKNDLPEVRSLDLSLVMAGPHGASVLSAEARVEPATDARSDWFVRRLAEPLPDTLPG